MSNNKVNNEKVYTVEEAVKLVKNTCKAKFDSSIELHINLGTDPKKQEQNIRTTTVLPHGTGKSQKVAVLASKTIQGADIQLDEKDLAKIESGELKPKIDFDVIVTEPRFMATLGKYGKVLGPAGVMPNPKTGTVTDDVENAVKQIKKGKVELRTQPGAAIIHTIIGKKSFSDEMLVDNFNEIIAALRQNRPQKVKPENFIVSVHMSASMSPSFVVEA